MSITIDRVPELQPHGLSTMSSERNLQRLLLACGVLSSLVYVAANVLGPMQWAGYNSMDQTVSELFPVDAPSRPLVASLPFVSGLLALAFGIGELRSAPQNRALRVAGWALLGIGIVDQLGPFVPMHMREVVAAGGATFSDTMHIATTIVLSLPP